MAYWLKKKAREKKIRGSWYHKEGKARGEKKTASGGGKNGSMGLFQCLKEEEKCLTRTSNLAEWGSQSKRTTMSHRRVKSTTGGKKLGSLPEVHSRKKKGTGLRPGEKMQELSTQKQIKRKNSCALWTSQSCNGKRSTDSKQETPEGHAVDGEEQPQNSSSVLTSEDKRNRGKKHTPSIHHPSQASGSKGENDNAKPKTDLRSQQQSS